MTLPIQFLALGCCTTCRLSESHKLTPLFWRVECKWDLHLPPWRRRSRRSVWIYKPLSAKTGAWLPIIENRLIKRRVKSVLWPEWVEMMVTGRTDTKIVSWTPDICLLMPISICWGGRSGHVSVSMSLYSRVCRKSCWFWYYKCLAPRSLF